MRNGFYLLISAFLLFTTTSSLNAQTALEKANKLYDLHAYRQAIKIYESFYFTQDENGYAATERLADCYWQLNNADKTIRILSPLVYADKASANALQNYGNALMSVGQYEQATTVFKKLKLKEPLIAVQMLASCQFAAAADNQTSAYKISPVSAINTSSSELSVGVFQNQLIWASSRTDLKRPIENGASSSDWTGAANHQLFIADIDAANNLGKIKFFKSDFKNVFNESYVTFSGDGRQAAFMRSNITDGRRISSGAGIEMSVYTASVDDAGNFFDVKPYPYNNGASGFPYLSDDGQTLYFASDRPGGFGGFDIYSARRIGTTWAEPRNLGNTINTSGDEITPFVADKTFYFSTNFQTGLGGYDIFKTSGLMTQVENLGVGINSSGDDFGFVLNPNTNIAYFISNRAGGKGNEDIYMARGEQPNTASVTAKSETGNLSIIPKTSANVPGSYSTTGLPNFTGMVTDGSTGEPLENVSVFAKNIKTNALIEATTDKRGRYVLPLNKVSDYEIAFSKEGFVNDKKAIKPALLTTKFVGETILKPSAVSNKITVLEETPKPSSVEMPTASDEIIVKRTGTNANEISNEDIAVQPSGSKTTKNIPTDYDIVIKPSAVKTGSLTNVSDASDKKFYAIDLEVIKNDRVTVKSGNAGSVYTSYKEKNFDKLKELSGGNVYTVTSSSKEEVRLGVFTSKARADLFIKKINTYNVPTLFPVVEEKDYKTIANNIIIDKVEPVPTSYSINVKKSAQTVTNIPTDASITVIKKPVVAPDTDYKVRIAAFKNPKLFDDSKVSQIGKISSVKQGALTIFLIDGFNYFDDARAYKKRVQEAGYKDAKVVVKDGDKFRVVD